MLFAVKRFVWERRDVKLRDCSRNGAVSARTGLVVVMLSWREVVHLCFLGIGYKEVVVRRNVIVSL